MSENLSPVTPETSPPDEASEDTKSKKKKKAIGAFVVEADPEQKSESFWRRSKSKKSAEKPTETSSNANESKLVDRSEVLPENLEELNEFEVSEVTKQLAAARRQELDLQPADLNISDAELVAADTYLAAIEASGDVDIEIEPNDSEVPEQPADGPINLPEIIIATDSLSEGELSLEIPPPIPPIPPVPPAGNGNGGGGGNQRPPTPGGPAFNTAPLPIIPQSAELVTRTAALANERQALTDGLVVGAVVGYLVGRRRGRIKTEKRLIPVQKKLEKQVQELQTRLITNEQTVREAVREKQSVQTRTASSETLNSRLPQQQAPERIGHALVAASAGKEQISKKPTPRVEVLAAKKRVESMDRQELLAISQTVVVEGTTLRKIYETQLITEKGLRRLIVEHLRGGNVARTLKREIIEREIDFERDPILRDQSHAAQSQMAGGALLAAMLAQAGVSDQTDQPKVEQSTKKTAVKTPTPTKSATQNIADLSLATFIGLLVFIILVLLMRGQ